MTDALKPCPFCGPGNSVPGLWFDDTTNAYRVNCGACGSGTGFKPGWTEAEAIAAWNRRAPQPSPATDALADELERLKTLIASFPAHAQDMGPDNTVFADHIPMDGAEIGECPRPIERLAEAILSALREREHQEEQS